MNHFTMTLIAGLIVLFVGIPIIKWFGKSKVAYKKFHEEDEESRRWRETIEEAEWPTYPIEESISEIIVSPTGHVDGGE